MLYYSLYFSYPILFLIFFSTCPTSLEVIHNFRVQCEKSLFLRYIFYEIISEKRGDDIRNRLLIIKLTQLPLLCIIFLGKFYIYLDIWNKYYCTLPLWWIFYWKICGALSDSYLLFLCFASIKSVFNKFISFGGWTKTNISFHLLLNLLQGCL